ncbi:hypothetical protein HN799_00175 [Candidatus Woesearchaeota archaeon]|nr:hypothetical protein [Candidatus Woesearchaeota archaeon]
MDLDEYYNQVKSLRTKIRTNTIDQDVLNEVDGDDPCCYFCFENPGELVVIDHERFPLDRECYELARTHSYIAGKPYEMN